MGKFQHESVGKGKYDDSDTTWVLLNLILVSHDYTYIIYLHDQLKVMVYQRIIQEKFERIKNNTYC